MSITWALLIGAIDWIHRWYIEYWRRYFFESGINSNGLGKCEGGSGRFGSVYCL